MFVNVLECSINLYAAFAVISLLRVCARCSRRLYCGRRLRKSQLGGRGRELLAYERATTDV